jgi:hypothetical protein
MHLKNPEMKPSTATINSKISLMVGASTLAIIPFLGTSNGRPDSGNVQKPWTRRFLCSFVFCKPFSSCLNCFNRSGGGFLICMARRNRFVRLDSGKSSVRILPLSASIPKREHKFSSSTKWTKLSRITNLPMTCSITCCWGKRSKGEGIGGMSLFCRGFFTAGSLTSDPTQ